ncbi:unnamed protein product [Adineta steineri]|uniref:Uncharacterized protein n=1 Tax=Adineta steineri TaxID=433720 RepID=A0A816BNW0_9BILA|nr:unnamed protein product [Adineta steineri]CAF1612300.1 unnamed protein product [Adineta steineri]
MLVSYHPKINNKQHRQMSNSEKKSDEEIREKLLQTNGDNDIDVDVTLPVQSQEEDLDDVERNIGHNDAELEQKKKEPHKDVKRQDRNWPVIIAGGCVFGTIVTALLFRLFRHIEFRLLNHKY